MYKDIQIINFDSNAVQLELNKNFNFTVDKTTLIQRIIKLLLTEKGSNAFSRKFGSYLNNLLLSSFTEDEEILKSNLYLLIQEITNTIKEEQENEILLGKQIPDYLLLDDIQIIDIELDETTYTLYIKLLIVTKDQIKIPIILNKEY